MLFVERASNGDHDRVGFNQSAWSVLVLFGGLFFFFLCNSCLYLVLVVLLHCILKFKLFQWEGFSLHLKKPTSHTAAFTLESASKVISTLTLNLFQTGQKYPFEACRSACRCGWHTDAVRAGDGVFSPLKAKHNRFWNTTLSATLKPGLS